jgi:hypothetical protein
MMYRVSVVADAPTESAMERAYYMAATTPPAPIAIVPPRGLLDLDEREIGVLVGAALATLVLMAAIITL